MTIVHCFNLLIRDLSTQPRMLLHRALRTQAAWLKAPPVVCLLERVRLRTQ